MHAGVSTHEKPAMGSALATAKLKEALAAAWHWAATHWNQASDMMAQMTANLEADCSSSVFVLTGGLIAVRFHDSACF